MVQDTAEQAQHLRLLSIFHYVVGGFMALFASFPLIHLVVGIIAITAPEVLSDGDGPPPELLGWLFVIVGGGFVLVGWTMAICIILAGRFLARRAHYTFCLVVAAVECIFMPLGTVLGVFTIIVLIKTPVKAMFEEAPHAH